MELARGMSQGNKLLKSSVILMMAVGEEDGLNGAHSFITQHPWAGTIRLGLNLEARGIGGKSGIFQAGSAPSVLKTFATAAKYPSGNIMSQDLFSSGVMSSATDFKVFKEYGISGLDFAFTDMTAVYHTKNDKSEFLKAGSIQHLGENLLDFLLQVDSSTELESLTNKAKSGRDTSVYFDILGKYMITYDQSSASILHNAVIVLSLLVLAASVLMGGYQAAISLFLSFLSTILTLAISISSSALVAFILPKISSSPVAYGANPWLVIGLFVSPSLIGALAGQHFGYVILQKHLSKVYSKKKQQFLFSSILQDDLYSVKLEAESWLFKAGFLQWLVLLIVGNYYGIGSTYVALLWLVPPAFAYGLLEATPTTAQMPRFIKLTSQLVGFIPSILISAGTFIRLAVTMMGNVVQGNVGGSSEWLGSAILAVFIAVIVSLTLVNILSYVHLSGAINSIILATGVLFGLSLASLLSGFVPPFSEHSPRAVNVVHVVDTTKSYGNEQSPNTFVYLFSKTPGKLTEEAKEINEGFSCGDNVVDFATFSTKYGCVASDDKKNKVGIGWSHEDVPTLQVDRNTSGDGAYEHITINTRDSTRWALAINTDEVEDFILTGDNTEVFIPKGNNMTNVDGWHVIQFAGGKKAPQKYILTLFYATSPKHSTPINANGLPTREDNRPLLKLRTDVNRLTPKVERVLNKLPKWCSLYGDSTYPYTLTFLSSLPVNSSTRESAGVDDL